jgi:threonyl-tRNA synthetase
MNMHARYYRTFEISDFYMRLALPDLGKLEKYVDSPEQWREAINIIRAAMRNTGLPYREARGEAAFYGPKVDFIIKSAIGTENAISTNQLDFLASKRFALTYIGEDGKEHPLYVIHRAPLGSHERFVAFLIEHYGGNFPIWLAPVQVMIVPISDRHLGYANEVQATLKAERLFTASAGLRVEVDSTSERMQKKVRSATVRRIPMILVVGEKEEKLSTVSVRLRSGRDLGQVELPRLIEALKLAVEGRDDAVIEARLRN